MGLDSTGEALFEGIIGMGLGAVSGGVLGFVARRAKKLVQEVFGGGGLGRLGEGVKNTKPKVTAEATVDGVTFKDTNQTARPKNQADADQPTLISERISAKEAKKGKELPNGNMATAHAEIGSIQQAANAGKTKGADMSMTVKGKDVCGFCKGDVAAAAEKAELKSLTIKATDDVTGLPKTYHWKPGMKSIKEKP